MQVITARNVNEALYRGVQLLNSGCSRTIAVRGMNTLEVDGPVCTTYLEPRERVLMYSCRDANPFFHLMESLWILAGRDDVKWLSRFNLNIATYSDDGVSFHAAYGHRLRVLRGDQVERVVSLLRRDPNTRRAVLQIWDSKLDLNVESKDIPCNDLVFLKIRDGRLDITVSNRSNDMVWGAYGANVVQFSMLQEYVAAKLGVRVGVYSQVSDSFHVYTEGKGGEVWGRVCGITYPYDPYTDGAVTPYPLVSAPIDEWERDLSVFMSSGAPEEEVYSDPFFDSVVVPAYIAWSAWKSRSREAALVAAGDIVATDWRMAMTEWLERRIWDQNG